jgi:hypothetical protein
MCEVRPETERPDGSGLAVQEHAGTCSSRMQGSFNRARPIGGKPSGMAGVAGAVVSGRVGSRNRRVFAESHKC